MRFLAVLLPIAVSEAPTADRSYELKLEPSARAVDGRPLYVTDEQIAARIPDLGRRERIETCMQGMTQPMLYYFTYVPTVIAPHQALTNTVQCEGTRGEADLRCHADVSGNAVVFDADPRRYFSLGAGTDRDAAIEVFRAFNEGRIVYSEETKPSIKGLEVREITRQGPAFAVRKADCGCNESVVVERRGEGAAASFVAIRKLDGMCI